MNTEKNTEKKGFNISRWALEHSALTRYLMIVLMVLGIAAYFQLGQDEDPPFTFRVMTVRAYWPGASAQQMADQVTAKLERTLQEVPKAGNLRSFSKPGETLITFELKDSTKEADVQGLFYTVRKKIGDIKQTLPSGVQGPFFNDDFGDVYGVLYALRSDGFSLAEMKDYADTVRQRLLQVPDVAKVDIYGDQEEQIFLEISQKRLAQLGLTSAQVLDQLSQQNAIEYAGEMHTKLDAIPIRVAGQLRTLDDIKNMPIRGSSGKQLRLGDIADVKRSYVDPKSVAVHYQGEQVVALGISMSKGGDIIQLGKALKQASEHISKELPAGLTLVQVQDQPKAVATSVNEFVRSLMEAVVIVLAVSFVSLGLHKREGKQAWWKRYYVDIRPGLVVAITIPLVLALTFLGMRYWGIGLHKISLGSLIIALGLLVDDAIIAVEMMVRKMEEGYDRFRAATYAYEVTAMPMLTGTLITAAGFLPIGTAKSTVGEYTFAIFGVTALALVLSWIVSVYFVPYLGHALLKVKPHAGGHGEVFDGPFYDGFRKLVNACVRYRWTTIGITVAVFALGIFGMSKVQQQFFPDSSRLEILVDAWFPEGTSIEANEEVTHRLEKRLMVETGVENVTTWIGSGIPRIYLPLDQVFQQSNVSQLIVLSKDLHAREALRVKLPAILAKEFPEIRGRVKLLPNGPPVPYPVQFRLVGDDPKVLRAWADEVKAAMNANPHARLVNDNWNESIKTIHLNIDQDKARVLGVTSQSIAQAADTLLKGATVGQFREGDKLISIVLRQPQNERDTISDLANVYLPTTSGRAIPLTQIAKPEFSWEPGVMWREGRAYAITVQSDVEDGVQPATLSEQLLPKVKEIEARWREKYGVQYHVIVAGAVAESSKGQVSIVEGLPIALFVIFTLLMLQLQSFSRSVLVYLTGPLGLAGVAGALLIFNRPFGFVAMLGALALMGMIQRNSVILIDQIEQERAVGKAAWNAIVDATVSRLRPIVLTAAAAVLSMIPLTRSEFWGPMAVAIMGGLIVATLLTLLALPAMYAAWFRVKPAAQ
ncbi:efflux RND transporter permease subunit [Curvibacter sp. CHRR-16]|uniref:efflux RND transporter permease subunit n=1 Tax=Curvibacter sp. CHRR-16 TaxID=2835872 RepID=UPI001BDAA421|nr:efflux RND transporter permease subunit [Curvibacter sp. CHRR-16]MBT0569270.1 efflux RND transporter permease subunit [Curvibacter sp. CHRR-16]